MFGIKSLGVFCGSAPGRNPRHIEDARKLGKMLAENHIRLVYGAGHVGMMGAVAAGTLESGGEVLGVINTLLQDREIPTLKLTELQILPTLHIRKDALFEASDAFCVLPGGIGTLDEIFEVMTLKQLGEHTKPIIMYNTDGFWEPVRKIVDTLVGEGYIQPDHAKLLTYVDRLEDILPTIGAEIAERKDKKAS